jgi:hypothetical protein
MIGTIRKHSAVLWWVIVVAVIVSFVAWSGSDQSSLTALVRGNAGLFGTVDGHDITRDEIVERIRQLGLQESLSDRRRSMNDEQRNEVAAQTAFIDFKLQSMGIVADDEVLASVVSDAFRDQATGQSTYPALIERIKTMGGREDDYLAILRRQVEQSTLVNVLSIPDSLVTPREAEAEYRRENEEAVASAVFFVSTNFMSSVTVKPEGLGQFYTNRAQNYRIAEKFVVSYLHFPASNHMAAAEAELATMPDLTNRLEQAYASRPTNSFLDDQGVVLSKDAALLRMRTESVKSSAAARAAEVASEAYNELAQITPIKPENLDAIATKRGLKVALTQPFARGERPLGLESLPDLTTVLQGLTPDAPFSEPMTSANGAYILAIKARIPATIPPLASIEPRVADDYRRFLALEAARSAGQAFRNSLTNALAAGKTFAGFAAEQKQQVIDLPAFSQSMTMVPGLPPYADLGSLKDTAFALEPGGVSGFAMARDGGYVLFLKERKPVSEETLKAGLPAFMAEARSRRSSSPFAQWFSGEWEKSSVAAAFRRMKGTNAPGEMN